MTEVNGMTDMRNKPDQDQEPEAGHSPTAKSGKRRFGRRVLLWAGIPAAIASAVLLPHALAWDGLHGMHGGRGFIRHHGPHPSMNEDQLRDHISRKLSFVLKSLQATPEQEKAIGEIVVEATPELIALHSKGRELHESFLRALLAEPVDYKALERIRGQMSSLADQAGTIAVGRLGAASEVLTEQQRARLGEFIEAIHR